MSTEAPIRTAWRRGDQRTVSLTLLIPGVALSLAAVALVLLEVAGGSRGGLGVDLLCAAAVCAGFGIGRGAVLRGSKGIHYQVGLGWGAAFALISTISVIPVFLGGPLLVLGVAVFVVGLFQRNVVLLTWGVFAGMIGIYNQAYFYPSLSEIWLHPVLDLMVGMLTVALGFVVSRKRDWPSPV